MSHPSHSHVQSLGLYVGIFAALMILTGLTVWVAFQDLGALNTPMALGIAAVKATLVILYFMHVRHGTRLTKLVVVSGLLWLLILVVLTMGDYVARGSVTG